MYLEHASQVYARSSREQQTEILTLAVNRVDKFIKMKCKIIEEYKDENIEWV
jgi:thiazole synthase ThiGH ThiG subunit